MRQDAVGEDLNKNKNTLTENSISGVPRIANIPDDFIRGADISMVLALENSGVKYKYPDGTAGDIFEILSGAGVNYIRLRIWNDPFDSSAPYKGYGGGNCNLHTAKILGKRATLAGMKVLIDFHYSDFWADPAKQFAPKAWAGYSLQEKKEAVYNYTYNSLCELLDYGVDIGMVQIGNETNGSMCGVGGLYDGVWDLSTGVAELMKQGCRAVDYVKSAYGRKILKVLHFTHLLSVGEWYAQQAGRWEIDYDVFATSFYPMWDGPAGEMSAILTGIAKKYNKMVLVAETAYPFTFEDADGPANCINDSTAMKYSDYPVSITGQAQALYDVFKGVAKVNEYIPGYGLGAFYWEPAWLATEKTAWGAYGTGWASSVSGNYELLYKPTVEYFSVTDQGCSWDNMALFDKEGKATKALYVFNDIIGMESKISASV